MKNEFAIKRNWSDQNSVKYIDNVKSVGLDFEAEKY